MAQVCFQGFQAGDHNVQVNFFYGEHSRADRGGQRATAGLRCHAGDHHGRRG